MNTNSRCAVCRPYKTGWQELCDGAVKPCFSCNRDEFHRAAIEGIDFRFDNFGNVVPIKKPSNQGTV